MWTLVLPVFAGEHTALAERIRPAVVMLETRGAGGELLATGTGFFVRPEGLVVTNHHVAVNQPSEALLADGSRRPVAGLLVGDAAADLAILAVEGEGFPALALAEATPAVGDVVLVVGGPLGLDQTVTDGKLSRLWPEGLSADLQDEVVARAPVLQFAATLAPGSSGSPVVGLDGKVLGVAQSGDPVAQTWFAVDVSELRRLLAEAEGRRPQAFASPRTLVLQGLAVVAALVAFAAWPSLRARRS